MNSLAVLHDAANLVDAIERSGRPVPPVLRERYVDAAHRVLAIRDAVQADALRGLGVLPALPALGWLLNATGVLALVAAAIGVTRAGFEAGEAAREIAIGVRGAAATVGRALPWMLPLGVGVGAYWLARSSTR